MANAALYGAVRRLPAPKSPSPGWGYWQSDAARLTCGTLRLFLSLSVPIPRHLSCALLLCSAGLAGTVHAEDLFLGEELPEVLTATRLKQSPAAVPGSVSVIDRSLIEASGARDIPELMRLVPGMMVGYNNAGYFATVNYHGGRQGEARRLQVLIDGRSVYRPGLATVDWSDLPLAIEDLERIEVFRGPNTVSYGANALTGVISITTRDPGDTLGTRLKYTRGERGIDDWYGSQGFASENADFRLSISGQEDNGFDHTDLGQKYRDSRRSTRMQLSASHTLDLNQSLDWQLAIKEGSNQRGVYSSEIALISSAVPIIDNSRDIEARDYAGSMRWSLDINPNHSVQVQSSLQHWQRKQEWSACDLALSFTPEVGQMFSADPEKLKVLNRLLRNDWGAVVDAPGPTIDIRGVTYPSFRTFFGDLLPQAIVTRDRYEDTSGPYRAPVCGQLNNNIDETRFDFEIQDTLSFNDNLRLLSGASFRRDRTVSETYFGGALENDIWRIFGHLEWYLGEHWVLQGGAMFEDDKFAGSSLTPRVALNYLITPRHGLRFVYSEAVRSPDMFENSARWSYRMDNVSPDLDGRGHAYYYASAVGPGNLEQEKIRSREIGYNGQFDFGLKVDIKLFDDEIHRMISEPLSITEFAPSNANQMWFRGAEAEIDWDIGNADRARISYAYIDFDASHKLDRRLTPRHSGSAGWMRNWGQGWNTSLFYHGADLLNERRFERVDLRLAKRFRFGETELELAAMLQQRLDDEALTWRENLYDDRRVVYASAQLEF